MFLARAESTYSHRSRNWTGTLLPDAAEKGASSGGGLRAPGAEFDVFFAPGEEKGENSTVKNNYRSMPRCSDREVEKLILVDRRKFKDWLSPSLAMQTAQNSQKEMNFEGE